MQQWVNPFAGKPPPIKYVGPQFSHTRTKKCETVFVDLVEQPRVRPQKRLSLAEEKTPGVAVGASRQASLVVTLQELPRKSCTLQMHLTALARPCTR